MNAFKAVFIGGMECWLSDKADIRKRLLYWPLAIPALLVIIVAIMIAVSSHRTGQGGDMSTDGGVTVALVNNETGNALARVLNSPPTSYNTLMVEPQYLIESIQSRKATFALDVAQDDKGKSINLIYDKTRNYPHMSWVDDTKSRLNELDIAIKGQMLALLNVSFEGREILLSPISMEVKSFGEGSSAVLYIGLLIVLWMVLLTYPLECAKGVYASLYVDDIAQDILPLWLTARAKRIEIILGRVSAGFVIYLLCFLALLLHVSLIAGLLYYLIDFLLTNIDAPILLDPKVAPFTVDYVKFIDNLQFITAFKLVGLFMILGLTCLVIMLPGIIFAKSTEQARTNNMIIELGLTFSPILGVVLGYTGASTLIAMIPILGSYHLMLSTLAGDDTILMFLGMFTMNILLIIVLVTQSSFFLTHVKRLNTYAV